MTLQIASHKIGTDHPTYIVAEIGGNSHHDYSQARQLIACAAEAGADAVKTQVFTPDSMTLDIDQPSHRLTWHGKPYTLHDLYAETAMPLEWHADLMAWARECGVQYFGSVFDDSGIALGERLGFPAYKVASFELTHTPLIRAIGRTKKPVLLSTGMATDKDITAAFNAFFRGRRDVGLPPDWRQRPLVWLKCTSVYPSPLESVNLRTMRDMDPYGPYGISDHTRSNTAIAAAVALGAHVVERHLTLSRDLGGPDAPFSDEPHEFATMVRCIRDTESALGTVRYGPTEIEMGMVKYRRSIWVTHDIAVGETLTPDNLAVLRPEGGLAPAEWDSVLGRKATQALTRGTALQRDMVG